MLEVSGVDKKARIFSPWSHLLALLYAQFTHAMSLIDVCDAFEASCARTRARSRRNASV
ncbi:MAG: DUF4372 domain-containing protein [Candidatus Sumerlaeota bacterium]